MLKKNLILLFGLAMASFVFGESPKESFKEIPAQGKIVSVNIFKNGVFAVREEIPIQKAGKYLLLDPPVPIHGTFFVENFPGVLVRSVLRDQDVPLDRIKTLDKIKDFSGKMLRITLNNKESFEAEILSLGTNFSPPESLNVSRRNPIYNSYRSADFSSVNLNQEPLLLRKKNGQIVVLWNWNQIEKIEFPEGESFKSVKRSLPALLFEINSMQSEPGKKDDEKKIFFSCLSKGISWAPSYRIDLTDPQKLAIEQTALIVNEWRDLEEVDIELISGYPQILFEDVPSPINNRTSLADFFQALSSRSSSRNSHALVAQQAVMMNSWEPSATESVPTGSATAGDSIDTFYQKIGKKTIRKGDRLQISIAKERIEWKKLVCWNIADNRDSAGRIISRNDYDRNHDSSSQYGSTFSGTQESVFRQYLEPWDIIRFRNPFDFPISTGPATIVDKDHFLGQTMIYWVNSKEETSIGINKALSVRVSSREEERSQSTPINISSSATIGYPGQSGSVQGKGTADSLSVSPILPPGISMKQVSSNGGQLRVVVSGTQYRIAVVDALLTITNQRSEAISMLIHRRLSGEPLSNPETEKGNRPKDVLCSDSLNGINRRHELTWEVNIEAGKTVEIPYSFQVLVQL